MASRLEADILRSFPDAKIKLIEGSGGVFEVSRGDALIFSKKKLGRFPESSEILDQLRTSS